MLQFVRGRSFISCTAACFCGVLSMCALLAGCQPESDNTGKGRATPSSPQSRPVLGTSNAPIDETSSHELLRPLTNAGKLYVDSIPVGADVYVEMPEQPMPTDESGNLKSQGKTPLTLDMPQRRGVRVAVVWDMKEYATKVQHLPAMNAWIARFNASQTFGQSPLAGRDYFAFDTSETRVAQSRANEILALGPVYSLDDFPGNRLCALFIPRGIKPSTFHSLMPDPGSFDIDLAGWTRDLRYRGLSEDQAIEAVECLRRCGKYVALVKDRSDPNKSVLVASTAQRTNPPHFLTQTRVLDH